MAVHFHRLRNFDEHSDTVVACGKPRMAPSRSPNASIVCGLTYGVSIIKSAEIRRYSHSVPHVLRSTRPAHIGEFLRRFRHHLQPCPDARWPCHEVLLPSALQDLGDE
jgi:hypothetical protein